RAALAAPLVALVLTYMALAVLRMSGRNDIALPLLLGATALAAGAVIALAPQGGDPFLPRSGAALVVFALAVGLNLHSVSRAAFSGGAGEWLDTARPDAAAVDALRGLPLLPRGAPAVYTDEGGLAVASDVGPLARWYLYDRAGVSFLPTLQPGPALMLGMRPADGQPAIQGYTVRDLPLDAAWRPSAAGLREWWRWYVLRETFGAAPQERRAVLYQRT
ncbi:MAG: hypothetical protein NTZ05_06440, partial [Chloroflexi bacterium]|nr:hypothetical protein [Chloroflexota bacterium]